MVRSNVDTARAQSPSSAALTNASAREQDGARQHMVANGKRSEKAPSNRDDADAGSPEAKKQKTNESYARTVHDQGGDDETLSSTCHAPNALWSEPSQAHAPQPPLTSASSASSASSSQQTTEQPYERAPTWAALRRSNHPAIAPSRSIYSYERLNHIQEGTYGVVFRARPRAPLPASNTSHKLASSSSAASNPTHSDDSSSTVAPLQVAVKRLKLPPGGLSPSGFPITSLREIQTLALSRNNPFVISLREVCVGKTLDQIFLILEFMEHDLKTLLTSLHKSRSAFAPSEVKTLMHQLLSGVAGLHEGWVVHRDLKSSNLLMDNRGRLKLGDFGLARRFGDPIDAWVPRTQPISRGASDSKADNEKERLESGEQIGGMTDLVCTLWYRAPELIMLNIIHQARETWKDNVRAPSSASSSSLFKLHSKPYALREPLPLYDAKIDMWSIGCIFAELLLANQTGSVLFQGKDEPDQLRKIEQVLGKPNTTIWPDILLWQGLPHLHRPSAKASAAAVQQEQDRIKANLQTAFTSKLTPATLDLLFQLLHWDPSQRISARDALKHKYFTDENPKMAHPDSFGSFPSVNAGERVLYNTLSAPNKHAAEATKTTSTAAGPGARTSKGKQYTMEFDFTT